MSIVFSKQYRILFLQVQETTVRDNNHKKERRNASSVTPSENVNDNKMKWNDRDYGSEGNEAQTEEEHSGRGVNRMPIDNADDNKEESNIRMDMKDEESEELDWVCSNMTEGGSAGKSRQNIQMEEDYREDNESNITKGNEGGNREEGGSRMTMRLEDEREEEANRINMKETNDLGVRRRKRWCTRMEGEEEDCPERMAISEKQEHEESNPNNEEGSERHKVWEARLEKYTPSLLILAFLIFNLVYWPYWLNRHTHNVQDLDS